MLEHDAHVGELLKLLDDLGIANDTIVLYWTDNGPHFNTWDDAGNTPFRSEKNSNWEGAYRVPAFVGWPKHFPAGVTCNGIASHQGRLPTFAAAAGAPDMKEQLQNGVELNGRTYKNHIDGYDQLDYLSGQAKASPREVVYGLGFLSLEKEPVVMQAPDFGKRFSTLPIYDARTDQMKIQ